jgi:hypothetical protein
MNPPDHPTPRTDAALLSSDCACNCGHTFKLLVEEKHDQGKCVYTGPDIANGNDGVVVLADFARTLERELAAAKAELAIAENWVEHHSKHADDLIGENVRLRAEVERWKTVAAEMSQQREHNANEASRLRALSDQLSDNLSAVGAAYNAEKARAEKAEAALAEWSVLNLWGGTPEIIHEFIKGQQTRIHHCQDIEAELITERARLDYLGLHMGMPQVSEALNLPFSKCFPIRDAIDAAIKKEDK